MLSVVLVVQSFVFADGGVTALGANVLNMGVIGALARRRPDARRAAGAADRRGDDRSRLPASEPGSPSSPARVACAFELAISGTVPLGTVLPAMLGVHVLIGIGEAVVTVAAVSAVLPPGPTSCARPQGVTA